MQATITLESQTHPESLEEDVSDEAHSVLVAARRDRARRIKENRAKRASAAANAVRSLRSFPVDVGRAQRLVEALRPERVARELCDDDWKLFLDVVAETNAFVEAVTQERRRHPSAVHRPDQSESGASRAIAADRGTGSPR